MHLTINSQIFAHELRLLNKIAPGKPTIPILSHVLFTATTDALQLYATDLELGLLTTCPATIQAPGVAVLPAAKLLAMVEQFPNADVTLVADTGSVRLTCQAFHSQLQSLPAADFPLRPEPSGSSYALDAAELRRAIGCTRYAISDKAGRYFLQGALLALTDGTGAMVATDGKRLALALMPREAGAEARVVVPLKTLEILSVQTSPRMTMIVGERHLFFVMDSRTILSRTIDGEFPNYQRIVPKQNTHKAVIDRPALTLALKRVGVTADESESVTMTFTPGALDIHAANANIGSANERVFMTYDGEPITLLINWTLLVETLEVASNREITLSLKDARSPVLVEDGKTYAAVIMPSSA